MKINSYLFGIGDLAIKIGCFDSEATNMASVTTLETSNMWPMAFKKGDIKVYLY